MKETSGQDLLIDSADFPCPPHASAGTFRTRDGLDLRFGVFRSEDQFAKGTVVILQGRNESIEKYYETIRDLNAAGLWVATFDLRGQGRSPRLLPDPRKGHVRRFRDYQNDLSDFLEQIVLPDTRLPFYLLGHSTGALIALASAPELANRIERMVLCSPFVGLAGQKLPLGLIRFIAGLMTFLGLGQRNFSKDHTNRAFEGNPLTSDPQRFARNQALVAAHPELGLGPPTARWLRETLTAISRVTKERFLTRIIIPTVIIAPTRDGVVPYLDQELLARQFRSCELIAIPGARHEILQERDLFRMAALAAITAFIPGEEADTKPESERLGYAP